MSNETVTLTRETYHILMDESDTLRAFQEGLPVLISDERIYSDDGFNFVSEKKYEVLYDGDEALKELVKTTSEGYIEISGIKALLKCESSSASRGWLFTWIWFAAFAVSIVIHFIR